MAIHFETRHGGNSCEVAEQDTDLCFLKDRSEVLTIMKDMICAVALLHRKGIVPGNIGAENVLWERGSPALLYGFGSAAKPMDGPIAAGLSAYLPSREDKEDSIPNIAAAADVWDLGVLGLFLLRLIPCPGRLEER